MHVLYKDLLARLGLIGPCPIFLKVVCCVFSAYHTVKASVRDNLLHIDFAEQNQTFVCPALRRAWTLFAETFLAEAGERAIPCHLSVC